MGHKPKSLLLSVALFATAALAGCSSSQSSARYGDAAHCQNPPPCASAAAMSRYGSEARCEIVIKECWGVRWVAVPTYHQILVPIMRPAPEPEYVPPIVEEPPVYIPPTPMPEPLPPVVEAPPIDVPPAPEPPVYQPPQSYPEPPVYIPPPPVIRK